MIGATIDPQLTEHLATEGVILQHAPHSLLDDAIRMLGQNTLIGPGLETAWISGMVIVDLLLCLTTGQMHLGGIDDDNMVAHVLVRRVGRLVLPPQNVCDPTRQATERLSFGVDDEPLVLDLARLGTVCFVFQLNDPRLRDSTSLIPERHVIRPDPSEH